jgi:hypothetical protein
MNWLGWKGERCGGVEGVPVSEDVVVEVSLSEATGAEEIPDGALPPSAWANIHKLFILPSLHQQKDYHFVSE